MKAARKELGEQNPDKLVGQFNSLLDTHQKTINKFLDKDGAKLSGLGLAATGEFEQSMKRLEVMQSELDRVARLMREERDRLQADSMTDALFKSDSGWLLRLFSRGGPKADNRRQ